MFLICKIIGVTCSCYYIAVIYKLNHVIFLQLICAYEFIWQFYWLSNMLFDTIFMAFRKKCLILCKFSCIEKSLYILNIDNNCIIGSAWYIDWIISDMHISAKPTNILWFIHIVSPCILSVSILHVQLFSFVIKKRLLIRSLLSVDRY